MSMESFSDWFDAMGDQLIQFSITERVKDKIINKSMYYENIVVDDDFFLMEDFNGFVSETALETSGFWVAGAGDNSNGTTMKGVFYDDRGWIHDFDATGLVEKVFTFTSQSATAGWSSIKMYINYPLLNNPNSFFRLLFTDGTLVAMDLRIIDQIAYVMDGINPRALQIGAVNIDPSIEHSWEFRFNNTTKKIAILLDGNALLPETGFDDYFNILTTELTQMNFSSGVLAVDSSNLEIYFDNIEVDWIASNNMFHGWLVEKPQRKEEGIVGSDGMHEYILRVDGTVYPIALSFRKLDEIKRVNNNKIYKIIEDVDVTSYINIMRFTVKETH